MPRPTKYTSPDLIGRTVITDPLDAQQKGISAKLGTGYEAEPKDYQPEGYASAQPFDVKIIPRDEWRDRIIEREEKGLTNRAMKAQYGIKSRTQGQSNQCWMFSAVQAVRYLQARQSGKVEALSPASVSMRLDNYQDYGGWCWKAVEGMAKIGINLESAWPLHAIGRNSRQYDTAATRRSAKKRLAFEWMKFPGRRDASAREREDIMVSWILQGGVPLPFGANWMRHAVTYVDPVIVNDKVCGLCDNSGLYRDRNGETVFGPGKWCYDDAVAPTSVRIAA